MARASAICLVLCAGAVGCRPGLPQPPSAPVDPADYQEVATSPRPAPVEFIPPKPRSGAVWVDGSWEWSGSTFGWVSGTWAMVPNGVRRSRWVVVRRREDGQLFFAPSVWRDAAGAKINPSGWIHALGTEARARTRIEGDIAPEEPPPPRPPNPRDHGAQREGEEKPPQDVPPATPEVR